MKDWDVAADVTAQLQTPPVQRANEGDVPNYWDSEPKSLVTTANVSTIRFGTGHSIYRSTVLPAIEDAQSEVILVTCFWARSATLDDMNDALRKLSAKAIRRDTTIRVRICLSSTSLLQKLLHTLSLKGYNYAPSKWQPTLGLPSPGELPGLDMQVKSIFVLPFSVMHPKFIIIDRQRVLLPSCNVSWEDWFEGCLALSGPITDHFVEFWQSFWASEEDRKQSLVHATTRSESPPTVEPGTDCLLASKSLDIRNVRSIFLPSPHHRNPRFTVPWAQCPAPPPTPLNICLLALFANAKKSIFLQTPNLTSPPVLSALLAALERGVDVRIETSERLMVLEQLVTAGTTTKRCVQKLIIRHKSLLRQHQDRVQVDLEQGVVANHVGALRVHYFRTRSDAGDDGTGPVQSHLKLTIVDDRITIHGSGNMDRASWYTSQELGVAFISTELAVAAKASLSVAMDGRSETAYDSVSGGTQFSNSS